MHRLAVLILCGVSSTLTAQQTAPAFEAASIKPSPPSAETMTFIRQNTGGRFVADNITVHNLIQQAYGLFGFQIVDLPDWTKQERFSINAVAPGTGFSQQGALLRKLLEDRFAFRARRETRDHDIYALVIARADGRLGPNLRPFTGDCKPPAGASPCRMRNGPNFTDAVGFSHRIIVDQATGNVQRIVVDKTGLTGLFDFNYTWINDPQSANAGDDAVSFMTALHEQLGLRLEPARGPVEFLVVERVERPTPN